MNLRNKMRKFFTLTRRANDGFTLIELIVVIAVLGILGGVGTVAYSGYMKKANMTADRTLVSEIENALTLAGYNGTFDNDEGGYIILSTGAVEGVEVGSDLEKVLIAAFGSDYADTLRLKYDGWGNNYLYLGLADGGAEAVYNSTYYGVSDQLMGQVKEITDAALSILDVAGSGNNRNDMIALFAQDGEAEGTSEYLNMIAGLYGYTDEEGNGDVSLVSDDELANFLVLAVAVDVAEANGNDDYEMNETSGLIQNFALYNGYAATEQGKTEGFDDAYAQFVEDLNNADDIQDVANAYKALRDTANAANSGFSAYSAGQGKTDVQAFNSMMAGLTSATVSTEDNISLTKGDLANDDFFTTGVGNALFGTYMDSVEAFVGIGFDDEETLQEFWNALATEGTIGIFFTSYGTHVAVNNSLPID